MCRKAVGLHGRCEAAITVANLTSEPGDSVRPPRPIETLTLRQARRVALARPGLLAALSVGRHEHLNSTSTRLPLASLRHS